MCVEPEDSCLDDCLGEWGGDAVEDMCGTCDNNPMNDCLQDCSGEWGGYLIIDDCGYCEQVVNETSKLRFYHSFSCNRGK